MKRIALIIDPGTHCHGATASALQLAIRHRAGIVIVPGIFLSSAKRVETVRKKNKEQLSTVVASWLKRTLVPFRQHDVNYEITSSSPISLADSTPILQSADLIVMGRPLTGSRRIAVFAENLLECHAASQTPIHLAGRQPRLLQRAVVSWDGSNQAMQLLKKHVYLHSRVRFSYTLVATATTPEKLPLFSAAESFLSSHGRSFSTLGAPADAGELLNKICGSTLPFELILALNGLNIHNNKNIGKVFAYFLPKDDIALFC